MDSANDPSPAELAGDALVDRNDHPIRLPVFEGPLDLLLYLIRKNEIDIHDIPIGTVMKQYLEVLRGYERMNLDVAGEFFVMAATLMYIKSRMLLPPEKAAAGEDEDDPDSRENEENLDPRWQLVRQLIQYKRIKESAGHLHALIEARQGFAQRLVPPPAADDEERPVANADRLEVWNTFNHILRRLAEKGLPGEIHAETVTITTRMEDILARLASERTFSFSSLLPSRPTIPFLVATFLACLELARLGKLLLAQNASFDDILCQERPADDPLALDFESPARDTDRTPAREAGDAFDTPAETGEEDLPEEDREDDAPEFDTEDDEASSSGPTA